MSIKQEDADRFLEEIIALKYECANMQRTADEIHNMTRELEQFTVSQYFWIFDKLQEKLESA